MHAPTWRERLDRHVLRTLPTVALVGALVYLLSILATYPMWDARVRPFIAALYVATALLNLAVWHAARRGRIPPRRANDVLALLLVLGAGHVGVNLLDVRGAEQSFSALLGILAAGVLLLSWRHFALASAAFLVAGLLVAREVPQGITVAGMSILLVAAVAISALLHGIRMSHARRVEELLDDNEQKRQRLEEALKDLRVSQQQAIQREKLSALGTLVAGVAHEINNPLTYIRGNVELTEMALREAALGPGLAAAEARELAAQQGAVLRGVDRIEHVTRSLRKVARSGTGARAPEDLNALVESVLTVAGPRVPDSVEVRRDLQARERCVVDGGELGQVLLHLVLNAIDAMPAGGVLTLRTSEPPGESVLEVEDTGVGIPAASRASIFTPFFTTKPGGTGLGLSISHQIVAEHGGQLSFEPREGGGTRFRVSLPRGDAAAPRPRDRPPRPPGAG